LWRTPCGQTLVPKEYFNIGGKTKWSGAALVRFQRHEFDADSDYCCRAWPVCYDEFERYYAEAENLLGVRSFEIEPALRRILDGLRKLDPAWEQHPLPLGLAPQILDYPEEARRFDGGFASPRGLKSDAEVCLFDRLKGVSHVEIVCGKEVVALEPADDNPKRVGAVTCADGSRYRATTVVLAAGALHSPRLLQRYLRRHGVSIVSASSEQIGSNYKHHLNSVALAVSAHPITDLLRKTVVLFHPACPHSSVQTLGWMDGEVLGARLAGLVPQTLANAIGARAYGFWLSTEDGSSPENRVIDAKGAAYPTLDYDAARLPEATTEHQRLWRMMRRQLLRLGFVALAKRSPIQSTAYACGTMVAGDDPDTSVVAGDGRVHTLDNLYVADGSALPRSGRVNPALTIYAWGLRVGDLLCRRGQE
jgi:choline dehydrogenase-like flavoprotein